MARLESNLQIGPWLASGHYGAVHLGTDDVHGEVAVKIFRQKPTETALEWAARKSDLLGEGQKLRQASHQNVVKVHQLLESSTDDEILLAMEFCSGGSLQKDFNAGPMSLSAVLKHSTEVSLGLQALHNRGMLHRDIKSGNLLVDKNGVTKLGDFGWVTDNLILGYGSAGGYLDHLAPEVHSGDPTSIRTDIWALGMTIYRLLHGATWYAKYPRPQTKVPDGGYAKGLRWLPHIPGPWRRVIRKTLNDDPDGRYRHTGQLLNALAKLPTLPVWQCSLTPSKVTWQQQTGTRKISVEWVEHSPKRHEWKAWSEPLATGRPRTLGGSQGRIGLAAVERELEAFFAMRA
jgi:serine/threonine-protein kinase